MSDFYRFIPLLLVCLSAPAITGLAQDSLSQEAIRLQLADPSDRAQVRNYLKALGRIHLVDTMISSNSPMIGKYAEVGASNLPALLEVLSTSTHPHSFFAQQAILRLATPDHRDIILAAFRNHVGLAPLISKYGWEREARGTIVRWMDQSSSHLNPAVVRLAASLNDAELNRRLLRVLEEGSNPRLTYEALLDLPEVDLDRSLAILWRRLDRSQSHVMEKAYFAPILAERGQIEGLNYFFEAMLSGHSQVYFGRSGRQDPLTRILQLTDAPVDLDEVEMVQWYRQNGTRLRFDPVSRKWFVPQAREQRDWTDESGRVIAAIMISGTSRDVTIRRSDGRSFVVPLERLSATDQEYVRRQLL